MSGHRRLTLAIAGLGVLAASTSLADTPRAIDFNRDIRPILSNKCLVCHGPDDAERQAGLRLDLPDAATGVLDSGVRAVVPGRPEQSALIARITAANESERMPPADSGKHLSPREIELLTEWIRQGARFAPHWSYTVPVRPELPNIAERLKQPASAAGRDSTALTAWPQNGIDYFILDRLLQEGLTPSPEADRYALVRRVSLDLTGLPPTLEEVDRFVHDPDPHAYEHLVERLLARQSYGEHWARKWLDLARYADSAGYADDPPRTIWAYRDYVIRALNANLPFDQFTIEQLAGDLLPNPTRDQLIATAFHRNTLTNNEGGTNDEEFRNVAVVDRVNTTLAVWMGTTINCAQCHSHKYDPISQEDFFRVFAIFNNTDDADRRDESPLLDVWTDEQEQQKAAWRTEIAALEKTLSTATPELLGELAHWAGQFSVEPHWHALHPASVKLAVGESAAIHEDGTVLIAQPQKTNVYTVDVPLEKLAASLPGAKASAVESPATLTALRLEALPHAALPGQGPGHARGNFVLTDVSAVIQPPAITRPQGRYVRVELFGKGVFLHLAEVQVYSGEKNIAVEGRAAQQSTDFGGPPERAIDGNTDGNYQGNSVSHTAAAENPWWEVDLQSSRPVDRIVVWNRTDNGTHARLNHFRVALLDEHRQPVWEQESCSPPNPSVQYALSGARGVRFAAAYAAHAQSGFEAANVLDAGANKEQTGWAIGPQTGRPHSLTLIPAAPIEVAADAKLIVTIEQRSPHENHTLGHFRLWATDDTRVSEFARIPPEVLAVLRTPAAERSEAQQAELAKFYLPIAPSLKAERERLAALQKQLAEIKPYTTVPVMRELPAERRRTTRIQRRGNFLDLDREVAPGVPGAFHPLPGDGPVDRLALARWLVDENNPLTPRVIANRYWEAIFGIGLVRTSEEFGSQGELPSHPELLDWLAAELVARKWDVKAFLKLLVSSATYRQSSRVTPELLERDPENRLLARGPRFRMSAEMIRDQALFVSGLLSDKMYGPPVKPPQPTLGVSAAFGSGIDWQTSDGDDRYRRGLYTTWRRSNPYPSMAAFDAPNREVCTIRRDRTNTPLQALVTLNDPVYIEAAQALARRIAAAQGDLSAKAVYGFRLCLARPPSDTELGRLTALYQQARERFARHPQQAEKMATQPLGPLPSGTDAADLAAWTVVGNVLLNLDEMLMAR